MCLSISPFLENIKIGLFKRTYVLITHTIPSTEIEGERIFAGAHLCNGMSAVSNDLYMCLLVWINAHHRLVYYIAYSSLQNYVFNLQNELHFEIHIYKVNVFWNQIWACLLILLWYLDDYIF